MSEPKKGERFRFRGLNADGERVEVNVIHGIPTPSEMFSLLFDEADIGEWTLEGFYPKREWIEAERRIHEPVVVWHEGKLRTCNFHAALSYVSTLGLDWGTINYLDTMRNSVMRLECLDGARWELDGEREFLLKALCRAASIRFRLPKRQPPMVDMISPVLRGNGD